MTNGNCVEVAGLAGEVVGVRDSKNPEGAVLGFTPGLGGMPSSAAFATASSIVVDNRFGSQRFVGAGRYQPLSGNLPPFNPMGLIWVLMSESTQGSDGPVMPVIPVLPVIEGISTRPAVPPPGTIFSLGWLMAELFDPRRRVSTTVRQPPFDADVQLPQVPDLGPDPKLVFLAAELTELVWWYPKLARRRRRPSPARRTS